ncbi:glycosyl transferase family group 2-domain-containing protein [Flammula alnicola]|nr:glycosyl transferase family group 2-domain-containing protein [Flammula alnicola]
MDYDRNDALLHWLFRQTQGDAWFRPNEENISSGVALRVNDASTTGIPEFRVFPYENASLEPFETAVAALNPVVAIKVRSAAVHAALAEVAQDEKNIYVDAEMRIQILETMLMLPQADREQCAAFIRDERVMVIWSESLDRIIPICQDFEERLIKLLWRSRPSGAAGGTAASTFNASNTTSTSAAASLADHSSAEALGGGGGGGGGRDVEDEDASETEKGTSGEGEGEKARRVLQTKYRRTWYGKKVAAVPVGRGRGDVVGERDLEGFRGEESRPVRLYAPLYDGLAAGIALVFVGNSLRTLLMEWMLDGAFTRFALIAVIPLLYCVSLFFTLQIVQNVTMMIGPIAHYHKNSKYYSAIRPRANKEVDNNLPHVTIQMPVYRESLETVLAPSIRSLKKAMQTYARQGGSSTIFINDDGLRLLSPAERDERLAFYANHNIGWVARPKHDDAAPDGFKRAGRFKKASNMNYALALSLKMEKHLEALLLAQTNNKALGMAIEEVWELSGRRWRPWAANGRATRIGEIVLIVDSDTVVPEDCLRDAAREMGASPTVAIIQHESDVMQVAHHYFENGIAYFTKRINRCISISCANGEVAPFMGHNAFLRWKAIQDAVFVDPADGKEKIWSESNVSEDFDMALRLILKGYIVRWATYSKGAFKEGVSLSVDDELNRWQKYSYGCNELLFNPIVQWWRKGPINRQIHTFLWSKAPLHYKISMLAYMFSYYGIAGSITISLINYVLLGFQFPVDGFFMHSFEIFLATTVVFWGSGTLGYTLLEYRLGHKKLLYAFFENLMWIPFFFFFFGGLSIPVTQAIFAHLFSYNIQWSATIKEVERSNFFKEIPKIARRFWFPMLMSVVIMAGMIICATPLVPFVWRVDGAAWAVILPLSLSVACHILFPIVLNPWLMVFSY